MERSEKDGIPKVALDLGLAESMLYNWRAKRRQTGQPFEEQKLQQAEIARLKRENARLEEEVAFLKKAPSSLRKKPNKVRVYSRATEDISSYRSMSSDGCQPQRLLRVVQRPAKRR